MTVEDVVGPATHMVFRSPMTEERANRIAADLAATGPATVADYACGWGELLLRVLALAPSARGFGVDMSARDLERGRANAAARGLGDRVEFIDAPARDHMRPADVVINSGAWQVFAKTVPQALEVLRPLVNPGGRLFFGVEHWESVPPPERLAAMWPGTTADRYELLPDIVDHVVAAGFRPLRVESSTRAEWEDYESLETRDSEEWLLANPGHPDAAEVRDQLDNKRSIWLRGHRDYFGFAMLTLGVPA
ncbi:Methyltransferase type 12 [Catenulispora acidiphila DSM 44928]|uniref:Methyltransferase type 12 n=1 Tax=Catenulispora acidiphila (strain DSM 44928 / JCM 14897 / NBRC 102108 / NRRL B-24433 / ID139908) TaxID=479433 RepID=C7QJH9_CATAD|nr:class I SAM-dependent methyltransferase [Catenulispora acidiphila]ACU71202.1 Methyltransferase type 12 [Catenulispora acidiphila DSM 44928]